MKSLTRFCAPKPSATPTMPALATIGARLMPSSPSTSTTAMPRITIEAKLRSTEPIASARWLRRSVICPSGSCCATRLRSGRRIVGIAPVAVRSVSRRMARCASARAITATTTTSRIRAGVATSTRAFSASQSMPNQS